MEERLKNFISVTFPPDEVSFQAKHLISYLLQKSVSARFSPEAALSHPWITRELDADLPLTRNQQLELQSKRFELIDRFRKTINTLYFCSVTLCSQISESTQDSSHTLRSYKRVLID
jgi:serine/threonine protein kinase